MRWLKHCVVLVLGITSRALADVCAVTNDMGDVIPVSGDDAQVTIAIPFSFPYYCNNYESMSVCTNGFVSFDREPADFSNTDLPYNNLGEAVAVFWDDLMIDPNTILSKHMYDDTYLIQWTNAGFYYTDAPLGTFQLWLFRNGSIGLFYNSLMGSQASFGESATIGIQSVIRGTHMTISFDTPSIDSYSGYLFVPNNECGYVYEEWVGSPRYILSLSLIHI